MSTMNKSKTTGEHAGEAKKPHQKGEKGPKKPSATGAGNNAVRQAIAHRLIAATICDESKDYVTVDAKQPAVPKTVQTKAVITSRPSDREYARTMLGMRPVKTQLVQEFSFTSGSSNTVFNTVFPADLALAGDISSWLNLFDEMRMESLEALLLPLTTSASVGSSLNAGIWPWTVAFDPDTVGAVSSNSANVKASKHLGPLPSGFPNGTQFTPSGTCAVLQAVTMQGHLRLPSGPLMKAVLPGSSGGVLAPNPVQGAWVPTTTASAVGGYYKFYVPPLGPSIMFGVYVWIIMNVEFRMRG